MSTDATTPLVSVILPSYNHARYLPRRIGSILNQTYANIEVLILDDCSPDNSREVIQAYAAQDARIIMLFNEQNSGSTFKQWEKGLKQAKGKYIWIAESDDFAELTFLSELVPLLEADETVVLAYSNSTIVDEHDHPNGTTADWKNEHYQTQRWAENHVADGKQEIEQYLQFGCTINNASAVLFRRSSIDQAGGVDSSFRYAGDWMTYLKVSLLGRLAYKGACLSNYREHSTNASKKSFGDGSQRYERQRCFSYLHRTKALSPAATKQLLKTASDEFIALVYDMLRLSWRPQLLASYTRRLAAANGAFYLRMQAQAIRTVIRRHS